MKKDIHPEVRDVVFKDISMDFQMITKSTVKTKDTIEIDGTTYPLYKADISSASHPFYTGKQRVASSVGRAEKFRQRYKRPGKKSE